VIHTYRDGKAFRNDFVSARPSLVVSLAVIVAVVLIGAQSAGVSWADEGASVALTVLAVILIRLWGSYRTCGEIRLSDDGTCELETTHRVVRLHVNEIRSVQYRRDEGVERYTIHYQGGKLRATQRMTGLHDFLTRLKALNPAVNLTSIHKWPDLSTPATDGHGTGTNIRIRDLLFPLTVIAFLVLIAFETLAGK